MKRDIGILLQVLRAVEELENTYTYLDEVPGIYQERMEFHLDLAIRTGLVSTRGVKDFWGNEQAFAHMLTWNGHEYLDEHRHELTPLRPVTRQPDGAWRKAMEKEKLLTAQKRSRLKSLFLSSVTLRRPAR